MAKGDSKDSDAGDFVVVACGGWIAAAVQVR